MSALQQWQLGISAGLSSPHDRGLHDSLAFLSDVELVLAASGRLSSASEPPAPHACVRDRALKP